MVALGYSTEEEEFDLGVGCVSVPIFVGGTLIGAFTVSAPIERYRESLPAYLDALSRAAKAASDLGSDTLEQERLEAN